MDDSLDWVCFFLSLFLSLSELACASSSAARRHSSKIQGKLPPSLTTTIITTTIAFYCCHRSWHESAKSKGETCINVMQVWELYVEKNRGLLLREWEKRENKIKSLIIKSNQIYMITKFMFLHRCKTYVIVILILVE